jgi:four helix bundle protein
MHETQGSYNKTMTTEPMFRFEKLEVWQKAMEWIDQIYLSTAGFPPEERFGLTSQLRRSGVSVAANIAEGSGRISDKDFAHFVEIAYGSLMEAVCECQVAKRRGYLPEVQFGTLCADAETLSRMLSGLREYLIQSK